MRLAFSCRQKKLHCLRMVSACQTRDSETPYLHAFSFSSLAAVLLSSACVLVSGSLLVAARLREDACGPDGHLLRVITFVACCSSTYCSWRAHLVGGASTLRDAAIAVSFATCSLSAALFDAAFGTSDAATAFCGALELKRCERTSLLSLELAFGLTWVRFLHHSAKRNLLEFSPRPLE